MRDWFGAALVAAALVGCVGSRADDSEPPVDVKPFIVDTMPADVTALNTNFDDKVTLLGVQVDPTGDIEPGKKVKLVLYWKVDKPLDAGWKLFTHVYDASGERLMNIDNVGPLRRWRRNTQSWPPSRWLPGKVYVDTQTFTMPRKVKTATVQVSTGIWRGNERMPIKSGPALKDNRALVITLNTGVTPTAVAAPDTRAPQLEVPKLKPGMAPRIDGKLDDFGWATAASTGAFVNVDTGSLDPAATVQGNAKLLWDDTGIYLGFEVQDTDIAGGFDKAKQDQQLWTKDCVEVMIDPDGDGDNNDYYEIQVNPQNIAFDSHYDSYNEPIKKPDGPFGHQDWSSQLKSAVTLKGTIDDSKDKDEGYVVELKLPWSALSKDGKRTAPAAGSTWRVNLYAMQNNGGVAWSPILRQGNFHKASRFGRITWVDAPAVAAATPNAPARVAPPALVPGAPVPGTAATVAPPTLADRVQLLPKGAATFEAKVPQLGYENVKPSSIVQGLKPPPAPSTDPAESP